MFGYTLVKDSDLELLKNRKERCAVVTDLLCVASGKHILDVTEIVDARMKGVSLMVKQVLDNQITGSRIGFGND